MKNLIYATINIKKLKKNLDKIKKLSNKKKIWIVVKSNAYGHGIENIVKIVKNKIYGFAVSNINEAIIIRKNGWKSNILLLEGFNNKKEINFIIKNKFTVVIHNLLQINILNKIKFNKNQGIKIYLKLNSGMNRLGFKYKKFIKIWNILINKKFVKKLILMSHFSNINRYYIYKQLKIINYVKKVLNTNNTSLLSSFTFIFFSKIKDSFIRIGILFYGIYPISIKKYKKRIYKLGFEQIISLYSKIISIQNIEKKSKVGYGGDFTSKKKMKLGIVAYGYFHGYPINLKIKNKIPIYIKNIKTEIIGRISMNMMCINLTKIKNIKIGDNVEILGNNININKLSEIFKISSYNIVSILSKNLKIKLINN